MLHCTFLLFDHLSISVERYNIMNVKCKFLTKNRKRRKRRKEKKEEVGRQRELAELVKKEVNGGEGDEE